MKHLFNIKMVEGGSGANHLNEFNTAISQLSYVGVNFDEEIRALLILCSFPKSWNGLVMAVSNFVPRFSTIKYDDVIGIILSEETHMKTLGQSTLGSSLKAQSKGKTNERRNNSRNCGKLKRKSKGKRSQSRGPKYFGTMENQGIRRKIIGLERTMKETNKKGTRR